MTQTNVITVTAEGMREAKEKLSYLTDVRRDEIAEQIEIARGFGDLSENAEYNEALNEQSRLEHEIKDLEYYIRHAVVVPDKNIKTSVVSIGTTVTVIDMDMEESFVYDIVGPRESNPLGGKISNESPVGIALIGHKKGEKVTVLAPDGQYQLEIKKIERTIKSKNAEEK